MNYDNYFKLFYLLNKNNLIKENTKISPTLKNKIILQKNILKKEKNIDFFICEIKLENNKILLIEDIPLNFLISHTILIGENCELFEYEYENKTYISTKQISELFKNISNKKIISANQIHNLKFKTFYQEPKIIQNLKSYLTQYKKINFNNIHITKNCELINFVPTAKATHLNLAKKMNIPITNLIENNYIKDTNINIYDNSKLKEILKPKFITSKKIKTKICKKNKLILFNDINTNFYINIQTNKIIQIIENLKETNFDKHKLIEEILNKKIIKISENNGKYFLPIWKSISNQKYLEIENIKSFEELSGMTFKNSTQNFPSLYLQSNQGKQAIFKNKFLKNSLNKIIENLKTEENIEFGNIDELIIKLIFNQKTQIKTISKIENLDYNLIKKTINNSNYILEYIIQESIKENKLPQKTNISSDIENYLKNINYLIIELEDNFQNILDKKNLINNLFKITSNLKKLIKNFAHSNSISYSLLKITNLIIMLLEKIDNKKTLEIKQNYNEYFKKYNFSYEKYQKINFEIINLFNDIIKTNSLKKKYSILIRNKDLNKNYFTSKNIFNQEPEFEKYIKPEFKTLKKIFKYNYKEISDQIKNINLEEIETQNIKINNNKIELKKEYYSVYYKFKDYKIILDNKYFSVLSQK